MRNNNPGKQFDPRKFRQVVRQKVMPFNKVVELNQQLNEYNTYVTKKQAFNARVGRVTNRIGNVGAAAEQGVGLIKAIQGGDGLEIANGVLGLVAMGAAFFPPVGTAVAAVLGVATAILSLFNSGPSDAEIMANLIDVQTVKIENMIRDQTEILLKSLNKVAEQQVELADSVVKQLLIENYYNIMDDIHGVNSALKIKMEHINLYKDTCVMAWTDIATESDMQDVNLQFGRIGSYMQRFCGNKENMNFCGQLVYQYVLMAAERDMVCIQLRVIFIF